MPGRRDFLQTKPFLRVEREPYFGFRLGLNDYLEQASSFTSGAWDPLATSSGEALLLLSVPTLAIPGTPRR
jgi:hypothetical protein